MPRRSDDFVIRHPTCKGWQDAAPSSIGPGAIIEQHRQHIMKHTTTRTRIALATMALGLSVSAYAQTTPPVTDHHPADAKPATHMDADHKMGNAAMNPLHSITELIATVVPVSGSTVKGTVTFKKVQDGVEVTVSVGGMEPGSEHGFHVHEYGNASSSDGSSAGGHYNPEGHDHGLMEKDMRHAGDLGNLKADGDGNANKTFTVNNLTLAGMKNPIVGRAVVIHAMKDDGGQPTGNAGDRIGVGVIGIAKVDSPMKK